MKAPKYFIQTAQDASDVRINPFALTLLAESFADDPDRFGDENLILLAHAHNGHEVWFVMTKTRPTLADFDNPTPFDNPAPSTARPNPSDLSPQPSPKTE